MNDTYREAVDYIEETPKFTTKHSLDHTRECLRRLGNPEHRFKVIHVAGTNGKGSTCAFLTSILEEAGYSCGLFTSPHLVKINERFQINGKDIGDEEFLRAFYRVKELSIRLDQEGLGHPTYFEMLFLMGMLIFAKQNVDYVVLETGLGGRMDATTAVDHPVACVITSISLDHMQYLGNTVAEIASEKAGIIVPGVPVIYDANDSEAAAVIRAKAEELGCASYPVSTADATITNRDIHGIEFELSDQKYQSFKFKVPFIAAYQVMNASLAVKTMEIVADKLGISTTDIYEGILHTKWQGRMEMVMPGVIVDGAHNEDGVLKFVETAEHFGDTYELTLLFSAVDDKDYTDMIRTISDRIHFNRVVTTEVGGYRQVPAETLADIFEQSSGEKALAVSEPAEAFRKALELKAENGILFCVGSLYLVGIIKEVIGGEDL